MPPTLLNSCWNVLLLLKDELQRSEDPIHYCSLSLGGREEVRVNSPVRQYPDSFRVALLFAEGTDAQEDIHQGLYIIRGVGDVEPLDTSGLSEELDLFIRLYSGYCFSSPFARQFNRAVAVSHFAQSLDGRIATVTGDSRWISGKKNLEHAHRMRALCDGVLIGSGTVQRDRPQLTVRHVPGPDPVRIIAGSSLTGIDELAKAGPGPVWIVGNGESHRRNVEILNLDPSPDGFVPPQTILKALHGKGIFSVWIEGGATTTSHFLEVDCVDVVQLYISPAVFGSGAPSFSLPEIEKISHARRFHSHNWYAMDDGVLFVGSFDRAATEGLS